MVEYIYPIVWYGFMLTFGVKAIGIMATYVHVLHRVSTHMVLAFSQVSPHTYTPCLLTNTAHVSGYASKASTMLL